VTVVVVLGDPGYYSRFGFARAGDHGLGNEYGVGEHFMALELQEGAMAQAAGMVRYQPEFAQASC
jgi:putative acetyltransferase